MAVDYTLRDSIIETIIMFIIYSSLTMGPLEVFQVELQSLWTTNVHVNACEKLSHKTEMCSFEKGVEVMHCAERQHKQKRNEVP